MHPLSTGRENTSLPQPLFPHIPHRLGYALPAGIGASFRDLRAERGFLVSAEIDRRGRIGEVVIKSTAGGRCRVANPWKGRAVRVKPGRPSRLTGDILEFDTKPGGKYRLESTAR